MEGAYTLSMGIAYPSAIGDPPIMSPVIFRLLFAPIVSQHPMNIPLPYSFLHPPIRPYAHSPIRPFTRSFRCAFIRPFVHSPSLSFVRLFIHTSFAHLPNGPSIHASTQSFIRACVRSPIHSYVQSFVHLSIRSSVGRPPFPFWPKDSTSGGPASVDSPPQNMYPFGSQIPRIPRRKSANLAPSAP